MRQHTDKTEISSEASGNLVDISDQYRNELLEAVEELSFERVKALLEAGIDPNSKDDEGATVLEAQYALMMRAILAIYICLMRIITVVKL